MQAYNQPIQPNQVEQATQLINLIDRINNRDSGRPLEPGQSVSRYNTAQFQDNPNIAAQEMALRNPQQSQETLRQENAKLKYAAYHQNEYNKALSNHASMGGLAQIAVNGFAEQLSHATDMAMIGGVALELLPKLIQESADKQEVINILIEKLNNPHYLLWHCFENWVRNISPGDTSFINALSEGYMAFVEMFEQAHRNTYGRYTDTYTEYLNQQISQTPAILEQRQQQEAATYQNLANAMRRPGIGKEMQRMHSIRRQMQ